MYSGVSKILLLAADRYDLRIRRDRTRSIRKKRVYLHQMLMIDRLIHREERRNARRTM